MKHNIRTQLVGIVGAGALASGAFAGSGAAYGGVGSALGSATGAVGGVSNLAGAGLGSMGAVGSSFLGDISGSVAIGYDTDYYYRGVDFGGSPIWTGLDLSIPIADGVSFNPGVWYINPTSSAAPLDDELDYYASLDFEAGPGSVSLSYTGYSFPEAGGDTNEFGISFGTSVGAIDLGAGFFYDVDLETEYYELNAGTSLGLTDDLEFSLGATLGALESDLSHALVTLSLPIALTETASLEPYIAFNYALDATEGVNDDDEKVFGGIALSVGF